MYSLGTSFITTESLLSSIPTHGDIFPTSTTIFAAPLTIHLNFTCAFCESSFEVGNGLAKSRDMKQLENIALEYFKRRVLKVEEESLGDASAVFPDDNDGARYKKLLGSITLCDECISHFAKNEEMILRDQLKYLEKVTGTKKLEEVFADPWLDVKRLAFQKLKCQECTIKEKLELMENLFSSVTTSSKNVVQTGPSASSSAEQVVASTSKSSDENSNTTAQQILVTTVMDFPITSQPDNDIIHLNISKQLASCPSTTIAPQVSSKTSSNIGSPKQDKENDLLNDSTFKSVNNVTNEEGATATINSSPNETICQENESPQCQNRHKVKDVNNPSTSDASREEKQTKQKYPGQSGDEGHISDAESTVSNVSVRSTIPAVHMSPVVRLKPLSTSTTLQLPSASETNMEGRDDDDNGDQSACLRIDKVKKNKKRKFIDETEAERKESESSQEMFEDSNSPEGDSDSDKNGVEPVKKKGKRKKLTAEVKLVFENAVKKVNLSKEKELSLPSSSVVPPVSNKKTSKKSAMHSTPLLSTDPDKKSTSANYFATPPAPKKSGKSLIKTTASGGGGGGKKSKSLSMIELAREKLGNEVVNSINRHSRTSPRKEFTTPNEKPKKFFKIGNRYMTDPSSDESDDSDKNNSFVPNGSDSD